MIKPYYDQDGITIYNCDCRLILPELPKVDLVLTDPPYGIGAARNLRADKQHGNAMAPSKNYGFATWDDVRPNKELIDRICYQGNKSVIWGGNYFFLPISSCWLVWDKDNGSNGYADCELAWTNFDKAVRRKKYRWMGMIQERMGHDKEERVHPTQKPIEIMEWVILQAPKADTILDPFMGSGTTLVAAKHLHRQAIGIEIEEKYCEIAAKRLAQGVLPL